MPGAKRFGANRRHAKAACRASVVFIAILMLLQSSTSVQAAGQTITAPDTAGVVGTANSLQLDAAGNPVVSYYDQTNGNLKLLHCSDAACAGPGNSVSTVDSGGDVGSSTSLALDSLGNPIVAYYDFTNTNLKVVHCNDANCLGGDEAVNIADAVGSVGAYPSIDLDSAGNPLISYYDFAGDLRLMHCNDPDCTGNDESIVSPDGADTVGTYTSLELNSVGHPVVSYQDETNHDLKVLTCNDPDCAPGGDTITSPDTGGDVGYRTDLILDPADNPIVSHFSTTDQYMHLVFCNDPSCSGGDESIRFPDTSPGAGLRAAIHFDSLEAVVVGYSDGIDGMRLLKCGDATCNSGNTISLADIESGSGGISMELDSADRPIFAYYSPGLDDLRILRCADTGCVGNYDTDGDSCPDIKESQLKLGAETTGGRRSSKNPYDYFNPTGDGENRIDDVLAVVGQYFDDDTDGNPGLPPYAPGYNPETDRTDDPGSSEGWDLLGPNGQQRIDDILAIIKQYFHDCS